MTRGTFIYIAKSDGEAYKSVEFNGDMYLEGHGYDALRALKKSNSVEEFKNQVQDFCVRNFNGQSVTFEKTNIHLGFSQENYKKWNYSDYLYILNNTDANFVVEDYNSKPLKLPAHEIYVLYFGTTAEDWYNEFKRNTVVYNMEITTACNECIGNKEFKHSIIDSYPNLKSFNEIKEVIEYTLDKPTEFCASPDDIPDVIKRYIPEESWEQWRVHNNDMLTSINDIEKRIQADIANGNIYTNEDSTYTFDDNTVVTLVKDYIEE